MTGEILLYSITRVGLNEHVLNNHCIVKRRYTVYNIECTNISSKVYASIYVALSINNCLHWIYQESWYCVKEG